MDEQESQDGFCKRYRITPRELEVLVLVARGKTNDEIAGALGISLGTVKSHVASSLEKLSVPNRTAAATLIASELNL